MAGWRALGAGGPVAVGAGVVAAVAALAVTFWPTTPAEAPGAAAPSVQAPTVQAPTVLAPAQTAPKTAADTAPETAADTAPAPNPSAPATAALAPLQPAPPQPATPQPATPQPALPQPAALQPITPQIAAPQPAQPRFDVVRIEKDGSALVAGTAAPNAAVFIMVDAQTMASVNADASGGFAALFSLAPNAAPRLLTLQMQLAEGGPIASAEQVILSPGDIAPPASVLAGAPPELSTETLAAVPAEPATAKLAAETAATLPPPSAPLAPQEVVAALDQPQLAALPPATVADAGAPDAGEAVAPSVEPSAILIGPDGVRVLQPGGATAKAADLVIDVISYTAGGDVQLGGRGSAGAVVRIYLGAQYLAEFAVQPDGGWGGVLPDVVPGIHTLRADQIDAAANVTARFETPFQRETLAALAALTAPPAVAQGAAPPAASSSPPASSPTPPSPTRPSPAAAVPETVAAAPPLEPAPAPVSATISAKTVTVAPAVMPEAASALPLAATGQTPIAALTPVATARMAAPVTVTVQPGFTLWAIAKDQFGNGVQYVQVYAANKDRIRDPDLIYPGQVFTLPQAQP